MYKYLLMIIFSIMIIGCGSGSKDNLPDIVAVEKIEINQQAPSLTVGETLQLSATVKDVNGQVLLGRSVVWGSAEPSKLMVTLTGQVQAKTAGEIEVTATSEGKVAKVNVTVLAASAPQEVDSVILNTTAEYLPEGSYYQLQATAYDNLGEVVIGRGVSWSSSNLDIASVSADGMVTVLKTGNALIKVKIDGKEATCAIDGYAEHNVDLLFATANIGEHAELYSIDINLPTTNSLPVFPAGKPASHGSPSPDGTKIAFVVHSTGWESIILIADRNGDNQKVLVSSAARNIEPAWSTDGERIAFSSWIFGEGSHIWLINIDGSGLINLTADQIGNRSFKSPSWSSLLADDESRIAYSQTKDGFSFIWTMKDNGSDKKQITSDNNYFDDQPDWSPDGTTLVFQRSGTVIFGDLYLVSATGGIGRPLMPAPLALSQLSPKWSPDGKRIAFTSKHDNDDFEQIWTVWADGTRLVKRTFEEKLISDPNWITKAL